MTKNEILQAIYQKPLNMKIKMSVPERCELQKLLVEALKYDYNETDNKNVRHHHDSFIDDIQMITSAAEMSIAQELATIAMAVKRIGKKVGVEAE